MGPERLSGCWGLGETLRAGIGIAFMVMYLVQRALCLVLQMPERCDPGYRCAAGLSYSTWQALHSACNLTLPRWLVGGALGCENPAAIAVESRWRLSLGIVHISDTATLP
jgi:hypothetical protein